MFTVEEFKKIFELKILSDEWVLYPESDGGIHYFPKEEENSVYAIYIKDGVMTRGIATYRLFLQEVIEGINRAFLHHTELTYIIDIEERYNKIEWFVYHGTLSDGADLLESGKSKNVGQAKESAIRYVLEMEG